MMAIDPTRASGTYRVDAKPWNDMTEAERIVARADMDAEVVEDDLAKMVLEVGPAPCKHEWRQYMDVSTHLNDGGMGNHDMGLILCPHGFFCIHCTERKDE